MPAPKGLFVLSRSITARFEIRLWLSSVPVYTFPEGTSETDARAALETYQLTGVLPA